MASEDPVIEADADGDDRVPPHDRPGSNESSVHVGVDAGANDEDVEDEDSVDGSDDESDAGSGSEDAGDDEGSVSDEAADDASDTDDANVAPASIPQTPDPPPKTPPVRGNTLDSRAIFARCRATDAAECTHATCSGGDFARLGPARDLAIFAAHLVVLDVGDNALGRDADVLPVHPLAILATSLPKLRRLAAPCNAFENLPSAASIAETAGGLRKLVELDLSYNSLDSSALAHLAGLPRLVTLNLAGNRVDRVFVECDTQSTDNRHSSTIESAGVPRSRAPAFPALERLDLSDQSPRMSALGDPAAACAGAFAPNLRVLNLADNDVGDLDPLRRLYESTRRLREVGASGNPVAARAIAAATRDAFDADDGYGLGFRVPDVTDVTGAMDVTSPRARGRGARSNRFAQWTRDAVEVHADSFVSVRRCELGGKRTLAVPLGGFNSFGKAIGRCAVMLTAPSEREEAYFFGPELATEVSFEVEEDDETFLFGGETAGSTRNAIDGRYSPYATSTSDSSASNASPDAVVDARPGSPTARLARALRVSDDDSHHRTGVFSNASEAYRSLKRALAKPGVDERDVRAALRGDASWAPTAARGTAATDAKKSDGPRKKAILELIDAEEERARAASRDVGMNMGSRLGRVDDVLARLARL
ncbi:predicted protein [Micromonas commoda]|uniref:Uncharacterized protein n=1 Tax=Micromonas commoda (strain RCC299 / NOUM17 / CCMP2709) TaxID=296587 RepID=C1ED25_MICCC|nr:predicted protein [Micromonas commoda]ACO66006.1 predicted protein [Micromonas commoda]|eukprot:XP_002504748.1 predicted protein [Micromonas commoda]